MTNGLYNIKLHSFSRQQAQRPTGIALRRPSQCESNELGFLAPIKFLFPRGFLTLLAVESLLKPPCNKSLTELLDGANPTRKGLCNLCVYPVRAVSVSLQKNVGTTDLLTTSAELFRNTLEFFSLFSRQSNDVLLFHDTPPSCHMRQTRGKIMQPELLILTRH